MSNGGPHPLDLELLAGDIGGPGNADGIGASARFNFVSGVAVDSAGNVYIADWINSTIRKIAPAGGVTTIGGSAGMAGSVDGTGSNARFKDPAGVAVDSGNNVYVADQNNHTIRKITPAGDVTTPAGTAGMFGSADGTGAAARFGAPAGMVVDSTGNVYVADTSNSIIRKITATGIVTTLAGSAGMVGSTDGMGAAARFNQPSSVAVDSVGNVYVADQYNSTIRKVTPAGIVTTLAGAAGIAGSADGLGTTARLSLPAGVAVDSADNIYVADSNNSTIRKITTAGIVTTLVGTAGMAGSADGMGAAARFGFPTSVAVDSAGTVYVGDQNNTVRKVTPAGVVTTLAGTAPMFGSTDGAGAGARFLFPTDVAVDGAGNVYVADQSNNTVRKVTPAGVVTTLAGTARMSGSTDGTGAAARFFLPAGVAVDGGGNVYVADLGNATIRKVNPAGVVTTLAGAAGMPGSTDGTGAAARFYSPTSVAVDGAGSVYVADQHKATIRKVTTAGVVTTLAGTADMAGSVDGTGAAARFDNPIGVAVDSAGNVYVADQHNSTIRKITAEGFVTTLAGTAGMTGSTDGTGADARFNFPSGVAVDSADNVYVVDQGNSTLRKVTPAGITTTIAGTVGVAGILIGATPRFAFPGRLAIVGDSIVLSDTHAILLLRHGAQ